MDTVTLGANWTASSMSKNYDNGADQSCKALTDPFQQAVCMLDELEFLLHFESNGFDSGPI